MTDNRPQVFIVPDERTQKDRVILIRPAPKMENLVLRGGGAKGVGYGPALAVMEEQGQLSNLKHLVGSSAGGLSALVLASGSSAADLEGLMDKGMMPLLDTPKTFKAQYPEIEFGTNKGSATLAPLKIVKPIIGNRDAGNALVEADHVSAKAVEKYLREKLGSQDPEWQERYEALLAQEEHFNGAEGRRGLEGRVAQLANQDYEGDRTKQMVTFSDLHFLHQLQPDKFRDLTLTGWDDAKNKPFYFNVKTTPNMPVAMAARITMAIPPAFKPLLFDPDDRGDDPNYKRKPRQFADGGIGTNMPIEALTRTYPQDPRTELPAKDRENLLIRTGIVTFDEFGVDHYEQAQKENERIKLSGEDTPLVSPLGGAYLQMHGSRAENRHALLIAAGHEGGVWKQAASFIKSEFEHHLSGNDIRIVDHHDQRKIAESGPNCFVIGHGTIGTFDLDADASEISEAKAMARNLMIEQLDQRKDSAYYQEFTSIDEAYAQLSPEEKRDLAEGPDPDLANYAKKGADASLEENREFFQDMKDKNEAPFEQPFHPFHEHADKVDMKSFQAMSELVSLARRENERNLRLDNDRQQVQTYAFESGETITIVPNPNRHVEEGEDEASIKAQGYVPDTVNIIMDHSGSQRPEEEGQDDNIIFMEEDGERNNNNSIGPDDGDSIEEEDHVQNTRDALKRQRAKPHDSLASHQGQAPSTGQIIVQRRMEYKPLSLSEREKRGDIEKMKAPSTRDTANVEYDPGNNNNSNSPKIKRKG